MNPEYPKRLIEVDLPIKEISAHARREKSIRHGHISTLHIWWARRPLAACRAVLCAALWPDPFDENCPQAFRDAAAQVLTAFAGKVRSDSNLASLCQTHWSRWNRTTPHTLKGDAPACWPDLRYALLDFIADFANWDASTVPAFLETARALTQAAHEALGGLSGTRSLVVDPFAGGGSIPLEALRVGADAFASDLNPVAVLLNKVLLEYIPKYGQRLADEVRKWGLWIKEQADQELAKFYPKDEDGATPIAYLWARTITCEGPGCGAEVPLIRSLWLAKRKSQAIALRLVLDEETKRVDFKIVENVRATDVDEGTVRKGSATCPVCGYTTPVASVRRQLKGRHGGAADARLFAVVTTRPGQQGRSYRLPTNRDWEAIRRSAEELGRRKAAHSGKLSLVPDEEISLNEIRRISVPIYGITTWGDMFAPRQVLAMTTLSQLVQKAGQQLMAEYDAGFATAAQTLLALAVDKQADLGNSLNRWEPVAQCPRQLFARQAIGMIWDFAESVPTSSSSGGFATFLEGIDRALGALGYNWMVGHSESASASHSSLPDDAADALITDPPYYDAVPYAHLSDFFYIWLRRMIGSTYPGLFNTAAVPKDEEIVVDRPHELSHSDHDIVFYERALTNAFSEGRRVLRPNGIGTIVFASKTTASWEAILQAALDAGWVITGSWPVDTEMTTRISAQGQARLASSVHIVCRPRETSSGEVDHAAIGDWRDVLAELPKRIHAWMPRLASEGVVGADAIFACLGPALEIYSRYSRVERANGEQVTLREYLEQVWAAVAHEALTMIFEGADASGFEEDARLTAMWLWTLSTGGNGHGSEEEEEGEEEEESGGKTARKGGYFLEYDAARKIAQGLGAHLERLTNLVEIKGDQARLLPVSERTRALFGQEGPAATPQRKKSKQLSFFETAPDGETAAEWGELDQPQTGTTVLDRIHQAMLFFAAGRGEALRRFLVEGGVGQEARFWRLAQALSALYPASSEEKRWVDGLLARKKGLGL